MFEQLIMFAAGFITSYLIIRAIRSFRSTVGIVLMGMVLGQEVYAFGTRFYITNASANTITAHYYRDGAWTAQQSINPQSPATYYPWYYNGGTLDSFQIEYPVGTIAYQSPNYANGDIYYTFNGGGPTQYTQYCGNIQFSNLKPMKRIYVLSIAALSGEIFRQDDIEMYANGTYTEYLCLAQPWQWEAQPLFDDPEHPEPPQGGDVTGPGTSTNQPPVLPPPNRNDPTPNPGDIIGTNTPLPNPPLSSTNGALLDRQNTQAIIDALGVVNDSIKRGDASLEQIANTLTNGVGGQTNIDYTAQWRTNSQQNAMITNLLTYLHTNISGVSSNLAQVITNTSGVDSNDVLGTWDSQVSYYSNYMWTKIQGMNSGSGMSGLTNFGWRGLATNVAHPGESDFLQFTLGTVGGVSHKMDLNYQSWLGSGLVADAIICANWMQKWASWAILLVLYIAVCMRLDELQGVVMGDLRESGKVDSGAKASGYAVKLAALPLVLGLFAFIIILPTVLVTMYANFGGGISPAAMTSTPVSEVAAGSVGGSSFLTKGLKYFSHVILMAIPWGVASTAFMNYLAFFQASRSIANFIGACLWALQRVLPMALLLLWPVSAESSQLKLENLTTNQLVWIDASGNRLAFASGVTHLENLASGTYQAEGTNIQVPVSGKLVVRASYNAGLPPIYWQYESELSMLDCYLLGMQCGMMIFGTAWAVSATWQGWQLRHGGG